MYQPESTTAHDDFASKINRVLIPKDDGSPKVLDLFAGCGGLALGFEAAGFATHGFEKDENAAETYRRNLSGECTTETLSPESNFINAEVVIGGPPCQPFSVGGKQLGLSDSRDGFPTFIAAIEKVQPKIWMFENVRGMLYANKLYFEEIMGSLKALGYIVEFELLNAVDYGVPQNRERVIVIGHKGVFNWPMPERRKTTAGEALGKLAFSTPSDSRFLTQSMDKYIAKYEKASMCVRPRDLHLDRPARTLTCRNLAGATGDMHRIRLPDGRRRRVNVREAARLQSFPDFFEFTGNETSQLYQIGNAVAPLFAYHLASQVREYLNSEIRYSPSEILYRNLPNQLSLDFAVEESSAAKPRPMYLKKSKKKPRHAKLINQALHILDNLGIPLEGLTERRMERTALAFLAVCNVKRDADWAAVKSYDGTNALKTREIIRYINANFDESISPGSYDDIRRKDLKLLVLGEIVVGSAANPNSARNDPTRSYALSPEYAHIIQSYGDERWLDLVEEFISGRSTLKDQLEQQRLIKRIEVKLPSGTLKRLSPGAHNLLQKTIIEEFLPRYGYGSDVLYLGDASNKFLVKNGRKLKSLRFFDLDHGALPDIVAYSKKKNWLYLIEAVHSSGPINATRLLELKRLSSECTADIVFVTAFLDRNVFRKFAPDIAWETEVWIADAPDHLVHFNGDKFLGPFAKAK